MSKLINTDQTINIVDITGTESQDRIREDYKDIKALSRDIKQNGQLVPVWLTEDLKLIAGGRRLEALKLLKKETVRADIYHVDNEYDRFCLEVKENIKREKFSVAETAKAMKIMLEKERELAEKKRLLNLKQGDSPSVPNWDTRETREDNPPSVPNWDTREDGRADAKVAKEFDVSKNTLRRMIEIYENKNFFSPEDFAKWDTGKYSTNKMYNLLHPKPKTDNSSNLKPKTKKVQSKTTEVDLTVSELQSETKSTVLLEDYQQLEEQINKLKQDNESLLESNQVLRETLEEDDQKTLKKSNARLHDEKLEAQRKYEVLKKESGKNLEALLNTNRPIEVMPEEYYDSHENRCRYFFYEICPRFQKKLEAYAPYLLKCFKVFDDKTLDDFYDTVKFFSEWSKTILNALENPDNDDNAQEETDPQKIEW